MTGVFFRLSKCGKLHDYIYVLTPGPLYEIEIIKNNTFPDPTPIPIVFPDTAEHDGRYSGGSHTKFSELYVIHALSELKPPPWYRGPVTLGAMFEADDALTVIVPISV